MSANAINISTTGAVQFSTASNQFSSGTLPVSNGGTGAATLTGVLTGNGTSAITGNAVTNHSVLLGGASNAITSLGPTATAGQVLQSSGSGANPAFSTAAYPSTSTINQLLYSSSNNVVAGLTTAINSALVTDGSGVPSLSQTLPAAVQGNITTVGTITSGTWHGSTIDVAHGGTGATTFNSNGVVISNTSGTGALAALALTSGQIVIGGTSTPAAATLSAGVGIQIVNGNNSITISGTGSVGAWTDVTGVSQAMAVNNGYVADNAGLVTLTLPATAAFGSVIQVTGLGAGGWTVAQNSSQLIHLGSSVTSTGTGGSLSSTNQFDSLTLVCVGTNNIWNIVASVGNITVV